MDTELALKLTEIVEKIGDTKNELGSSIAECKKEIAVVKERLGNHLDNEEKKNNTKHRLFDKKTVVIAIVIAGVGLLAAFK